MCAGILLLAWRKSNPVNVAATALKSRMSNPEKKVAWDAAYYLANKDAIKSRTAAYSVKNAEKVKLAATLWAKANPEKRRAARKKWTNANTESDKAYKDAWRHENAKRCSQNLAAWRKNNPEAWNVQVNTRRARKANAGGVISKGLVGKLFALQKGMCMCCGGPLGVDYHLDHVMPLALGGLNVDSNMQLLRKTCNLKKHMKHPIDFMQSRGFLL